MMPNATIDRMVLGDLWPGHSAAAPRPFLHTVPADPPMR
jgi:hypothetical protein